MIQKIKGLDWAIYSKLFLFFLNISVLAFISILAFNTKDMSNSILIGCYLFVGAFALISQRFNQNLFEQA